MSAVRDLRRRHARNELRRNPGVNAALAAMIVLSACLMASGAMVIERLTGAIDHLLEQAQPPHFLQMHAGDYDPGALNAFAADHPEIDSWFIEEMVGFDGAAIAWARPGTEVSGDFSDSLIDNLFVAQSPDFDLLIDLDGGVPRPEPGQVYVPVALMDTYGLRTGDALTVTTASGPHEFTIGGFVRDAQMASSLSSAVRFLVAPADRDALTAAGGGAPEIIVEYLLTDPALATDLERAYTADASLPMNGQAVTYTMIRTIHAISDGIAAITVMLVAVLLVAIAMLNVRFTIAGRLEEDVRQIGAMRAIGLPGREIARLYLSRYVALTALGCTVGGALALAVVPWLTRGMRISYGTAAASPWTVIALLLALALVAALVIVGSRRLLGRVGRVQVVDALVRGSLHDPRRGARRRARSPRRARPLSATGPALNRRLALIDLRAHARQWLLVPIVFFLAALVMALPAHLLTTLSSPSVVTAMGAPQADMLAHLRDGDDLDGQRTAVVDRMAADGRLSGVQVYADVLLEVQGAHGWQGMRVEMGDGVGSSISYTDGGAPGPGEIALSALNADEHGLRPGDTLQVRVDGAVSSAVVSGVYADVTSGGYTAKMHGDPIGDAVGYTIYADVVGDVDPVVLAAEYEAEFPGAGVLPMQEYVRQTTAHLTGALRTAAILAAAFGVGVATLIVAMFLPLRVARERRDMGIKSAIGFSTAEIVALLRGKALLGMAAGAVLGALAALVLGGPVIDVLLGSAGLGPASLQLAPHPLLTPAYPMLLLGAGAAAAVAATARLRGADTSRWLRD